MSSREEKVKEAILKTGLPIEIKATQLLRDAGWIVGNDCLYLDRDEKIIRALDISATKNFVNTDGAKSDNPFGWSLIIAGLILIAIGIVSFYKITKLLEEQLKKKEMKERK